MLRTVLRSAADQLRMQGTSLMALLSGLAVPCVYAYILHSYRGGRTDAELAVGIAGVGLIDALVVLIVIGLLAEKKWKTLEPALSTPGGLAPVVLGRLLGMGVQSTMSIPGTLLFLVALWGLEPGFSVLRWLLGTVLLAVASTSVAGLLGYVVLRFPFSPGMTNGLVGLTIAVSTLLAPGSSLPPVLSRLTWFLPQAQVMTWVRGGTAGHLGLALIISAISVVLVYTLLRSLEWTVRTRSIPLEA